MESMLAQQQQENLCIFTDKVYDWTQVEGTGSTSLLPNSLTPPLPTGAENVQVQCMLTDANGVPLALNAKLDVVEDGQREDRQFVVDNAIVTLQEVSFTKTIYVVLVISGSNPATGAQFVITSDPFPPFNFYESVYLCAPPGTSLVVRVSSFRCKTRIIRDPNSGVITRFGVSIMICQSVQSVAPVIIEVPANLCMPREALAEQCGIPFNPKQCPSIFPRA